VRASYDQQATYHHPRGKFSSIDDYNDGGGSDQQSFDSGEHNQIRNDKPISISFRNNILDECNDHYENMSRLPAGIPSTSPIRG
jgi:hypothetical protein